MKRIEICGAIATGKTTLARAFTRNSYYPVFEDFTNIVSLVDFYNNQRKYAFETEVIFTLHHYYQVKKALSQWGGVVCDFSFVGDYAFATTTLDIKEFSLYKPMLDYVLDRIGKPDKLIILEASTESLVKRIARRNRTFEKSVSAEYLGAIKKAIDGAIKILYADVPTVSINTEQINTTMYTLDFLNELLR